MSEQKTFEYWPGREPDAFKELMRLAAVDGWDVDWTNPTVEVRSGGVVHVHIGVR